jgi:hypothetical protein
VKWTKGDTGLIHNPKLTMAEADGLLGLPVLPWLHMIAGRVDEKKGRLAVDGRPLSVQYMAGVIPDFGAAYIERGIASLASLGILEESGGVFSIAQWAERNDATGYRWVCLDTRMPGNLKFTQAYHGGAEGLGFTPWLILQAGFIDDSGRLSAGPEPARAAELASGIPGATAEDIGNCIASLLAVRTLALRDGVPVFVNWSHWLPDGWAERGHENRKPSDSPEARRARKAKSRARRASIDGAAPEA